MSELRRRYFQTLGIGERDAQDRTKLEAALKRAYELRDFEIEHYWKRATYFWGFQLAIFTGIGLLWKSDAAANPWSPAGVALAALGVLTAFANALTAHGSKFWQDNWEAHIDLLEDSIEGRLYKTVWLKDGKPSFSVSRINRCLGWCIVGFWTIVLLYVCWGFTGPHTINWSFCVPIEWAYCAFIFVAMLAALLWLWRQRSRLEGSEPNDDGSHGKPIRLPSPRKLVLMWRYTPDENQ